MNAPPWPPADLPLAGVRVLITRTARDGDPLRHRLEALGADVSHLPTIAIEPPDDWGPADRALSGLRRYRYIVFTSRNAVEAVFGRLSVLGLGRTLPPGPEIVAAGEATARRLRELGVDALLRPDLPSVRGVLAMLLARDMRGHRLLYPTSDLARPDLREGLSGTGALVDQVVVYRTVRPRNSDREVLDALRGARFDVLTVASPSAVHNLIAALYPEHDCLRLSRLVCIGETTARATQEAGLHPTAVAREPSAEGLVEAVCSLYRKEPV